MLTKFTPAQIKPLSSGSRRNSFSFLSFFSLFFTRGGCVSCLRGCLGARLLPESQFPNLSEGADRVGGQLRGDKECPFSGVTKSGRVWRKMPESDGRSVRRFQEGGGWGGGGCLQTFTASFQGEAVYTFRKPFCAWGIVLCVIVNSKRIKCLAFLRHVTYYAS